ncbi:MAG: BPSL0067 family protein [Planctomycetes bacterium]|nr:BPSL0067 family protein [Planctomycetota bacterium]
MRESESSVLGKAEDGSLKYPSKLTGMAECVAFVQAVTSAPPTTQWRRGEFVKEAKAGSIARGTAVATFDENGKYPTDTKGKHAAIYLSHDAAGITVLDQWAAQGEVNKRTIRYKGTASTETRSNNGDWFYVIE